MSKIILEMTILSIDIKMNLREGLSMPSVLLDLERCQQWIKLCEVITVSQLLAAICVQLILKRLILTAFPCVVKKYIIKSQTGFNVIL